jgi:hypothetical protein
MAKKIWESEAVSIIVLPSGDQGREILDLAQDWSRSWLLTPALWMLADEIPDFDPEKSIELQVPPRLTAYLLGRDAEQNSVKDEVDVFWTLGSQPFKTIRFIAVRTEQDSVLMQKTSLGAQRAAQFIQRAVPEPRDKSRSELTGALFSKYNLVIAPTNERGLLDGVLDQFWDANLIAAAEDRSTPLSTDSFVKVGERFTGFALAHIATTAGLWAGLPISSAEINSDSGEKVQMKLARLQRVFVRGVTSDALSADVAHWALQKLNYSDTNFEISAVEGQSVTTIASERQERFMNELVEYIMRGPTPEGDNFLYVPFEESPFTTAKTRWFIRLLERIGDMGSGLAGLPRWAAASAEYRIDIAMDDEADEQTLYKGVPDRLAPRVKLAPIDVLIASLKPRLAMPTPDLWKHMRESISSAIDAPTSNHPDVLTDPKDGNKLVFATVDQVLPNPAALWIGDKYKDGTKVDLKTVGWLDAEAAYQTSTNIYKRIDELAPGIEDARSQLAETQKLVNEAKVELGIVVEDLDLIQKELTFDEQNAKKFKDNHTHKLPRAVTDTAKRKSEGGASGKKSRSTHGSELTEFLNEDGTKKKARFWKRIFRRKGGAKK